MCVCAEEAGECTGRNRQRVRILCSDFSYLGFVYLMWILVESPPPSPSTDDDFPVVRGVFLLFFFLFFFLLVML